jgi:hyaluronan synthase
VSKLTGRLASGGLVLLGIGVALARQSQQAQQQHEPLLVPVPSAPAFYDHAAEEPVAAPVPASGPAPAPRRAHLSLVEPAPQAEPASERARSESLDRAGRLVGITLWRVLVGLYFVGVVGFIFVAKMAFLPALFNDLTFGIYGMVVTVYLLSRFVMSVFYRPVRGFEGPLPTVAIVIPAMNEQAAIERTIEAAFALDYPADKISVFAVDDGSTDETWERMALVSHRFPNLHAIRFSHNRGKRAAMAAGIRATDAEIVCFVDSDSSVAPDALREIVKPFRDARVAAVTGHADVLNRSTNLLTLLQQVRYYVAFRVLKASESLFGAVTCASGCFSAYRRERLLEVLPRWETQSFLGREATFGDDRALTNMLLRNHRVVYQSTAVCETVVPENFKGFLVQQTRWKKSWIRESLIACTYFWRKNPIAAVATYVSNIFPLVAPLIIFRAMIWRPTAQGGDPWMYVIGLYAMAVMYSLYYGWQKKQPYWWAGVAFVFLYATVLIWQTYWALATARKTAWGTRAGRTDDGRGFRIIATIGNPQEAGIPVCDDCERVIGEPAVQAA